MARPRKQEYMFKKCLACKKLFELPVKRFQEGEGKYCSLSCKTVGYDLFREDRFWKNVKKTENCWNWIGAEGGSGYGMFSRKKYLSHRYSYELHKGKIPKGLWVLHHCDNKKCVNQKHLFLGTVQDNVADLVMKGKQSKGEDRYNVKLTENSVKDIRKRYKVGETLSELARCFEVTVQCISLVVKKINWKHI